MKQFFILSVFAFVIAAKSSGSPVTSSISDSSIKARATFDSLWVDYDVTEEGVRGMRIHLIFTVYEMKDVDSYVAIFFEDDLGDRLEDNNKKFESTGGDVALYKNIKPQYDPADYKNLELFMPYSELDLDAGDYNLTMVVNLIYANGDLIQNLTYHDFQYSKPENTNIPETTATASLEKIWVDYDVTEDGLKGMRIHVKFRVYNLKDVDADLAIYFQKKNGDKLTSNNTTYRSKSGELAIYRSLKPGYNPETVYSDLQLFMPYNEFILEKGRIELRMDVDVIYANGNLVKHLDYHDFWFEQ